ncbi:hypothetical protein [Hymenobacter sp. B81]|uniref:hypothetical protein n=1 Tax=Hymenobacter sp. B81 TaxID=3344878 RepID=UPI0037DCFB1E
MQVSRIIAGALTAWLAAGAALAQAPADKSAKPEKIQRQEENLGITAHIGAEIGAIYRFDTRYEGLKGSPYLVKGWNRADLITNDGRHVKQLPVRYDVYGKRLIVRKGQDSIWVDKTSVREFLLFDAPSPSLPARYERRFRVFADAPDADLRGSFVELLHEGPQYALLKLPRKKVLKANYKDPYAADRPYDQLLDGETYFLRRPDGSVVEVKASLRSLAAADEPLGQKLKAEAIRTKVTGKSEAELVDLLQGVDKR